MSFPSPSFGLRVQLWALLAFAPLAVAAPQNPGLNEALIHAAETSDESGARTLLDQGANADAKGAYNTALEFALLHQNISLARLLLERGAHIEDRDLEDAARGTQGDKAKAVVLVNLLLDKGANLRLNGGRALQAAALAGNLEAVQLLLARGVPVDSQAVIQDGWGEFGATALMKASRAGEPEMISLLLAAGADVRASDERGETALMKASDVGRHSDGNRKISTLQLLLDKGADVGARDKSGQTALMHAVRQYLTGTGGVLSPLPEVVRLLLDHGVPVNAQDSSGNTALMEVAGGWNVPADFMKLLLDKGADTNLRNKDGFTALMMASEKGAEPLVRLLLRNGANARLRDNRGATALTHAIEAGQPAIVRLLLDQGDGARATAHKTSPAVLVATRDFVLLRAASRSDVDEVSSCLAQGAHLNARNARGETPLLCNVRRTYDDAVFKLLLQKGADVNAADVDGWTPLMAAAARNEEFTRRLLERGAAVNARSKAGETALHIAAGGGHARIAQLLINHGAEVSLRDKAGRTPLLRAVDDHDSQAELVELLLKSGANVEARDPEGNTPLILAASHGALSSVGVLLAHDAAVNARNRIGWTVLMAAALSDEGWADAPQGTWARTALLDLLRIAGARQ